MVVLHCLTHKMHYGASKSREPLTQPPIYLHTPRIRVVFEKLTGFQLVKKFPAFYGTRKFITAFTSARHLSYPEPARSSPYPHISNIHLKIILPSTPGSPKLTLTLRFPTKTPIRHSSPQYAPHAPPISLFSILSPEQNWVSSAYH